MAHWPRVSLVVPHTSCHVSAYHHLHALQGLRPVGSSRTPVSKQETAVVVRHPLPLSQRWHRNGGRWPLRGLGGPGDRRGRDLEGVEPWLLSAWSMSWSESLKSG